MINLLTMLDQIYARNIKYIGHNFLFGYLYLTDTNITWPCITTIRWPRKTKWSQGARVSIHYILTFHFKVGYKISVDIWDCAVSQLVSWITNSMSARCKKKSVPLVLRNKIPLLHLSGHWWVIMALYYGLESLHSEQEPSCTLDKQPSEEKRLLTSAHPHTHRVHTGQKMGVGWLLMNRLRSETRTTHPASCIPYPS